MAQTILQPVKTFDANEGATFKFEYFGSSIYKHKLTIRDNATNAVVYEKEVETMKAEHELAADSGIENGKTYNAEALVMGIGSEAYSSPSNRIIFQCYSRPVLTFQNISDGEKIENSSLFLSVQYDQAQSDRINSYEVKLFDSGNQEIWSSGAKYPAATDTRYLIEQVIYNLEHNHQYTLQVVADSISGLAAYSDKLTITASYLQPDQFALVQTDNLPDECSIRIATNVVMIDGIASIPPVKYVDCTKADLTEDGHKIIYNERILVNDNFEVKLRCEQIQWGRTLFEMSNGSMKVMLKTMRGVLHNETDEKLYFVLRVNNKYTNYVIISNLLDISMEDSRFVVVIQRINHIYNLTVMPT